MEIFMFRFIFSSVFVLFVASSFAQEYNYTLRNYNAQDGLPQSQVNVMLEDKNGYLWIGTQGGGLARYDGREFKVYTTLDGLLSNMVSFLKLDSKSNLWIVHPRGISKFDGVTFKKFIQPDGEKVRRIRKLFEVNDTIFMHSASGQMGKIYNDSLYYWAREVSKDKRVLYSHGMPGKEVLICLSDSSFTVQGKKGTYSFSHKNKFNVLRNVFNYKNKVIVKTDKGYFQINLKKRDFDPIDIPLKNWFVYYDSARDVFWSRNDNVFLKEYVYNGKYQIDTVMRGREISQVFVDSEMNTWICTLGNGLYKYFIQDFDRCSSESMQFIMSIVKSSDGASWVGSQTNGIWRVHKGQITNFFDRDSYKNEIHCIAESPTKQIFAGTSGGLGLFQEDKGEFKWFTRDDGLSNNVVASIQFDNAGGVWMGTNGGGLNYYNGKSYRSITTKEGLSSNSIQALHYSKRYGKLFYGTEYGVGMIDDGLVKNIPIHGTENTSVLSINAYKDSVLLIGTSGAGIAIWDPTTDKKKLLTVYDGLPSGFIYFVAADPTDYIWVGTEKGITRLKLDNNFEILENVHYGFDNGLRGVETNQNSFYLGKDEKYFGLIDGLYQFNETTKEKSGHTFDLHLTSVELLYGEFNARNYSENTEGFFKLPLNPEFDPDKNHVTFRFNRVNKQYPKSVRYKYYLDNYDKKWSLPSSNNYVTYSNLPPGNYTFRAVGTDANGGWGGNTLVYSFVIKTPFYQTATFMVVSFLALVGAIILIAYIRVRQRIEKAMEVERIRLKEQENLRKEIARDFHDEMGNQLTRIINYVSLLKLNGSVKSSGGFLHHDLYTKVENSAKYLYTGTRDFIWSIDPVNDELSKLFIHIRDFGEKLFEEKDIRFRATNEVKGKVKLPNGFSRQVNLILKEAMTNAFKYAESKNALLSLQQTEGSFEICFEDDGKGFNTSEIEKMNGLKNIRERADKIQAVLRISSKEGSGTKISLNFQPTKTQKYGITI